MWWKILTIMIGIGLFGGGGYLAFEKKGFFSFLGLLLQLEGLVLGLLGLILLVIPDFFTG